MSNQKSKKKSPAQKRYNGFCFNITYKKSRIIKGINNSVVKRSLRQNYYNQKTRQQHSHIYIWITFKFKTT